MDVLTPEQRRRCMQNIKSRDTRPEVAVRSICHRLGFRFRISPKDLPGKPDLVFPRLKICIFVHGCFWHQHPGCKYAYLPKTRVEFWKDKFSRNFTRDNLVQNALADLGWLVVVVWECELKDRGTLTEKLHGLLVSRSKVAFMDL
ncbi:very short patch repair endonuclease [Pseudomonas alliivorans]|nr:very short patch repair endonuclease [Pseudomonas alliivorans]MEE4887582.1 very short patch repair endonuclease [Pseudomonas alliivorans]